MAVVGLLAVYAIASDSARISDVMRDASSKSGSSPFLAMGSDLGMYCWVASLAIGIVSLILAAKHRGAAKNHARYLVALLLLTLMLFLDDRLMLHEYYCERILGIDEMYVLGIWMLAGGLFFFLGAKWHHLGGWPFLLTSLSLFALSVSVDRVDASFLVPSIGEEVFGLFYLIEDGFKLAGIMFWLVFVARVGMQVVRQAEASSSNVGGPALVRAADDPASD